MRQHGWSQRRTWRKVHWSVDADTGEVQAVETRQAGLHDAQAAPRLLQDVDQPIASVAADGAYDRRPVYTAIHNHSPTAQVAIPPRKDARIGQHGNRNAPPLPRDENLRYLRQKGRSAWKRDCGDHRRSLAETAVFRFKMIFGEHLSARLLVTQSTQVRIRCRALNVMTHVGMPDSYRMV